MTIKINREDDRPGLVAAKNLKHGDSFWYCGSLFRMISYPGGKGRKKLCVLNEKQSLVDYSFPMDTEVEVVDVNMEVFVQE